MSGQSQNMEESLRNLDINAAEQFSRDWFGDHANWSHEKLLALRYGKLALKIPKHTRSPMKWRISCPHGIFAILEIMPSVDVALLVVSHRFPY